jgi:penicillin amidase
MKYLLRIFYGAALLFVILILGSWIYTRSLGQDVETLSAQSGDRKFSAQRDEDTGVWDVKAKDAESLWFAFGYLQAWDREFQLELIHLASLGQLSSMLGETLLPQDRLMRAASRAARAEMDLYPAGHPALQAADAFSEGIKARLRDHPGRVPVEYRLLGVEREGLPVWEPWHLFAVARFHAWQFSTDLSLDTLQHALKSGFGPALADLMLPPTATDPAQAQYAQKGVYGVARRPLAPPMTEPRALAPQEGAWTLPPARAGARRGSALAAAGRIDFGAGDLTRQTALLGASNAWIVADARVGRAPTLCNDPHLRLSWPSPLYPVRYELGNDTRATGVLLPGTPFMAIGAHEKAGDRFVWGITLASYADTQDLVALEPSTPTWTVDESYRVRDMVDGSIKERKFSERVSAFGPVVNESLDWSGFAPEKPVALDWLGFRRSRWSIEFFLKREIEGGRDVARDLQELWPFPAVNVTWMEQPAGKPARFGHAVTGLIFERPRGAGSLGILSETQARARKLSQPRDRPFVWADYVPAKPFFMAQSNQRVWPDAFSDRLAYQWEPADRADRVVATLDELVRHPDAGQTDWTTPSLVAFYKERRRVLKASQLCGDAGPEGQEACLEILSRLDRWDGRARAESWETTLLALWHSVFKEALVSQLGADALKVKPELRRLVTQWQRRSLSNRSLSLLMEDAGRRREWEKATGESLDELSIDSFASALRTLSEGLGPFTGAWNWGPRHRIDWLHPIGLAPAPWGPLLRDSLVGPPPPVSGALDSPGRYEYTWSPETPLEFPATHGAVLRMCTTFKDDGTMPVRWATATGPSGNPFSKWSRAMTEDFYLDGKLATVPTSSAPKKAAR